MTIIDPLRCRGALVKRAQNVILIFTRKRASRSQRHRWGHLVEGEPPSVFRDQKMPTMGNPRLEQSEQLPMFTGLPVNGDHFKRSRSQCVYLANVKFTPWKKRNTDRYAVLSVGYRDASLPCFAALQTQIPDRFVSAAADRRTIVGRGSCKPRCKLLTFARPSSKIEHGCNPIATNSNDGTR